MKRSDVLRNLNKTQRKTDMRVIATQCDKCYSQGLHKEVEGKEMKTSGGKGQAVGKNLAKVPEAKVGREDAQCGQREQPDVRLRRQDVSRERQVLGPSQSRGHAGRTQKRGQQEGSGCDVIFLATGFQWNNFYVKKKKNPNMETADGTALLWL